MKKIVFHMVLSIMSANYVFANSISLQKEMTHYTDNSLQGYNGYIRFLDTDSNNIDGDGFNPKSGIYLGMKSLEGKENMAKERSYYGRVNIYDVVLLSYENSEASHYLLGEKRNLNYNEYTEIQRETLFFQILNVSTRNTNTNANTKIKDKRVKDGVILYGKRDFFRKNIIKTDIKTTTDKTTSVKEAKYTLGVKKIIPIAGVFHITGDISTSYAGIEISQRYFPFLIFDIKHQENFSHHMDMMGNLGKSVTSVSLGVEIKL